MKKTLYRVMHLCMVLNFFALVITGVMRFTLPFSIAVTRLHIISGFIITILIGIHIFQRLKSLKQICKPRSKKDVKPSLTVYLPIVYACVLSAVTWAAAWWAWPGAKQIVDLSYESQNHNLIFRERDNVVGKVTDSKVHTFKLLTENAGIDVQLDWLKKEDPDAPYAVAIWAETKAEQLIETLHLSEPLKFKEFTNWENSKKNRGQILPIWRNRYTTVSGVNPDGQEELQSGPTKNHQFDLETKLSAKESFNLYVEINAPNDDQPSVLYVAVIDPERPNPYTLLTLLATGEGAYKSGEMNFELDKLTTAKQLIDKILVKTVWKSTSPKKEASEDSETSDY